MRIAVLGPLEVDEGRIALAPRDQVVLEALALRPGEPVRAEALAEALWDEHPPTSWAKVVQGCVSRLRKALGTSSIVTTATGYRLALHRDEYDHLRFEDLLLRAGGLLATGEPERARYVSGEALALWRGEPLDRLTDWAQGRIECERLGERRRDAEDLYADAAIHAGRHGDVLGELTRMVAEQPTRERRWGLLALAQYRVGRQAEALATLHRARTILVNEFGLDPGPELAELEEAILRQDPALVTERTPPAPPAPCPYLGLVAYDLGDAAAYFGREADVAACLRRLDETGVLAVVGPSGSGKSSLVRAGVAAALVRDGVRVEVVTPGPHPEDVLSSAPRGAGAVFVVDQLEEALGLDVTAADREAFLSGLVEVAGRGRLVLALRADRLGELASHPSFAHLVENGLYLLGAMGPAQLRSAIEGPAAQAGLRLEPGLIDLLVRESEGSAGALPLLSHVLRQIWRHREGNTLTVAGYAVTGGVRAAVAQSAERLYGDLSPTQQRLLHDLMVRLVTTDDAGEPVRTRVARRTVAPDDEHTTVVERLVGARLLSSDGDTVEIAHESLAHAWPRLRSWLDDDIDGLRTMRHLAVAAESWNELGRPDSELYRGLRQARAAEWHRGSGADLTDVEGAFLSASSELAAKEESATLAQVRRERRLNRRLRIGLGAVAALLVVSVVAGASAISARNRAEQQALVGDARRLGAEALRSDAVDRSLLLAVAALSLDDSAEARTTLLATLDRVPTLMVSARSAGQVLHLAVNTAADQVAVMAADGVGLELYDARDLRRLPTPEKFVGGTVVARPDGQGYAISTVEDGQEPAVVLLDRTGARSSVQLGGLPSGHRVHDMGFPRRWYMGFSPSSRWLAVSLLPNDGDGPTLTGLWDLQAPGRPLAMLDLGLEGSAPTVSPDGRTLYSGHYSPNEVPDGGRLLVTNLPGGATRRALTAKDLGVRRIDDVLAQSPDGRTLAVGAGIEVVLVDTATLEPRVHLSGQGVAQALAFSPDGRHLAASGDRLTVWDVSAEEPVEVLAQPGAADDPAFSRDGRTLYTKTTAGLLQAWDITGDRRFLSSAPGQHLDWQAETFARVSPDRTKVGYIANGPKFRVRDLATGTLGAVVEPPMAQGVYMDIAWHPDSRILNITSGDPVVRTWDSTTGRQLAERRLGPAETGEGATMAWFSVDGRYLLVGTNLGRLHVLDAHTLAPIRNPIQVYEENRGPGTRDVVTIAPSGDHRTVWLSDAIVDYVAGTVRPMPDLGYPVVTVQPSPDGKRLFVDTGPTGAGILDSSTMQWIARPTAARAGLVGLVATWSDDGSLVASVNEGRLSHWDGRTGAYRGTASVLPEQFGEPAFSKDGTRLLFAGDEGSVRAWDLSPGSWMAVACRLAGRPLTEQEWRDHLPDRPFRNVC